MRTEKHISKDTNSKRVTEEQRSVRVNAWVYAFKLEDDNDFHLIVGSTPDSETREFLNCEISGLPDQGSPDFETLKAARGQLVDLAPSKGSRTKYTPFSPPAHVWIEGSLFYDIDHPAGTVGPAKTRPATAWEIHPIASIKASP